jgi:hypothetical protein
MSDVEHAVEGGPVPQIDSYAEAVKETFRLRALRTVLLIDDQFPSYADVLEGGDYLERFKEARRGLRLYQMFKSRHMPCDVENNVGDLTAEDVERIRKSDLIILDYHLTPESRDNSKSIQLIRKLALTKHFNIVVLYTLETDLDGVWRDIAASLRCGWREPEDLLGESELAQWEELTDRGDLPTASKELLVSYIVGNAPRDWPNRQVIADELVEAGVEKKYAGALIEALIHRGMRERLANDADALVMPERRVFGACEVGRPRWVQSGNCFVALLGKQEFKADEHPTDADGILRCLDEALADWRPNLLQVLISEIQNILELEALATAEFDYLRDPEIQIGLSYQLLRSLEDDADPAAFDRLMPPLQAIIDKLVETLRHRLAADGGLGKLATTLLTEELQRISWPVKGTNRKEIGKSVFAAANELARTGKKPPAEEVFFALNHFLSTEPFRRGHLTTGTIFRKVDAEEFWVCAAPGCDMVVRKPVAQQVWASGIHPVRAMVAVRLHPENGLEGPLAKAERGRHVFVRAETNRAFSIVDREIDQPVYEFFFPDDAGRTRPGGDGRQSFRAFRVEVTDGIPERASDPQFASAEYVVVGQLRPSYASRILQMAGQHLSRIGVDFVGKPDM